MLSKKWVITNELKCLPTYCWYFIYTTCLGPKHVQLITMNSQDFQTQVVQSKGWLSAMQCGQDLRMVVGYAQGARVCSLVVVRIFTEQMLIYEGNLHKKLELYLNQGTRKSHFPLNLTDRHTDIHTDVRTFAFIEQLCY